MRKTLAVILIIFFGIAFVYRWLSIPNLEVSKLGDGVKLDYQNLGEYNSWLSQIEILNESGKTIWKATPIPTDKDTVIAIWTMEIKSGKNDHCLGISPPTCQEIKIESEPEIQIEKGKYQVIVKSAEVKMGIMKYGKRWFGKRATWFQI